MVCHRPVLPGRAHRKVRHLRQDRSARYDWRKFLKSPPSVNRRLPSEGLFCPRVSSEAGEANCRGEPAAKHERCFDHSVQSEFSGRSAASQVLSETEYPTRPERSGGGSQEDPPSFGKTMGKFCRLRIFVDARTHQPADVLLRLGSEGPEPRHGEAINNVKPRPRCSWPAG